MSDPAEASRAVADAVGIADRSDRHRLEVAGPDRAKYLHNLTTNDVKRLAAGRGHEAFVTSPQGKTLGYVSLLALEDRILLRTDPGALATLLPHLQKYGVFDEVSLDDIGARTFEFHLAGPKAEALVLEAFGALPGPSDLEHVAAEVAGRAVLIARERPTGRLGLTLIGAIVDAPEVSRRLFDAGASLGLVGLSPEDFEALRIEAGTPVSGRDVSEENLPQEVGRDARAINFVKGCYLGQETVARIDALGHVNRLLKGLRFPEPGLLPSPGDPIEADGKKVGTITSSASSPGWRADLALGYVRTSHAQGGTEVRVGPPERARTAVVADLPMLPPGPG